MHFVMFCKSQVNHLADSLLAFLELPQLLVEIPPYVFEFSQILNLMA